MANIFGEHYDEVGSVDSYERYEECWDTGIYDDQYCYECPHRHECSGSGEMED